MICIKKEILALEKELLKSEVRKSAQKISGIIDGNFIEFSSSGKEYYYKIGDVFQEENDSNVLDWEIYDFEIKELSNECILAIYKIIKHNEIDKNKKCSLRSSIWKNCEGKWKMIFHQGTLIPK